MKLLESPKHKLYAAAAALVVLIALAPGAGWNAATLARWLLAAVCIGGLAVWAWRSKRTEADGPRLPPRLQVVAKTGLSGRCGVALVEADGRSYLVAFGDGFAEVRPTRAAGRRRRSGGFASHLKRVSP